MWRGCGNFTPNTLLFDATVDIKEPQFRFILAMLRGNTVQLTEDIVDNGPYGSLIGTQACVYNEKQVNSANIIQRNWRICRYNPKYTMCHVVQFRNLLKIYEEEGSDIKGFINMSLQTDPYTEKLIKSMRL